MHDTGFTARAAKFAAELTYDKIPPEAIARAKNAMLDLMGVALAGSRSAEGRKMLEYVKACDEKGVVSLIGCGFKASLDTATLANGLFSHALDFDDCNDSVHGHPSVALVPVILSLCSLDRVTGEEALTAYVAGFEVEAAIGRATGDSSYEKGFHTTATLGVFGAAIAAGKLIRLDERQFRIAMGIAASMASGLKQNFGTMTKPLHAGIACRNGILAARLAKIGYTANEEIFEAQQGYPTAYCKSGDFDFTGLGEKLGAQWDILETGIILKKWPCCAETHRGIEAALRISAAHKIDPEQIKEVECLVQERIPKVCIYSRPETALEAKFSQEYCVAGALMYGDLRLERFEDEAVDEPGLRSLIDRVRMRVDPEQIGRGNIGDERTTVVVTMNDGAVYRDCVRVPAGSKDRPLSEAEVLAKFNDCAGLSISPAAADSIARLTERLETLDDISPLIALLSGV